MTSTWFSASALALAGSAGGVAGVLIAAGLMSDRGWTRPAPLAGAALWGAVLGLWVSAAAPWATAWTDLGLGLALSILVLIDLRYLRLPDALTLTLALAGLLVCAAQAPADLVDHLLGAVGAYVALWVLAWGYRRLRGRDGLGLGDAKLLAAGGAWLGWAPLPMAILGACGLAFLWAAVRGLRHGRAGLARPLAFGAPLGAALWLTRLYAGGA